MFVDIKVFINSKKAQCYYFEIFQLFNICTQAKPKTKKGGDEAGEHVSLYLKFLKHDQILIIKTTQTQ